MSLFVAVLLCAASTTAEDQAPLYQENFVLLTAQDEDEARDKALAHGKRLETRYENELGETVTWKLLHVVDVNEVSDPELGDGSELYTRHFRNYDAYRSFEPLLSGEEL
ncbi:DUF4288 domain-containing protein [Streptomyces sp. CBMA152]|uniref:DUF4288 domain-containing protein n=1 Tax=Streptomyces sp. CBMA152 TaxID=1896312 RepID=UPI001660C95D|nr:DUF4288 domain-containing protein [Streptomyces sp. CBMA152]MBD0743173.1 hypothetical protein [Streptomyces sp. CBMA152]